MKMGCNKVTIAVITVVALVLIATFTYLFWPKSERMDLDLDVNDIGDNNEIKTVETKEVSLFHIEGLASAQRTSNWMTFIGFAILLSILGYAAFHYKFVKGPRRIRKDMEREQLLDRLHELEEILVDMGMMKKKRTKKGKTKTKRVTKKGVKKTTTKKFDIEDNVDDDDDEDEE